MYKDKETVYNTFIYRLKYLLKKIVGTGIILGIGIMLMVGISGSAMAIKELMLFYSVGVSILIFYEPYHLVVYYLPIIFFTLLFIVLGIMAVRKYGLKYFRLNQ